MDRDTCFRERLYHTLSRITSGQVIGASGLAVLCAASALVLVPLSGQAPALSVAQWLGGLGLNVLAGVLQQGYQRLVSGRSRDEQEQLATLAELLTEAARLEPRVRREMGTLLGEANLDAVHITQQVVKEKPTEFDWLLLRIYEDVTEYRQEFDQIHAALADIDSLIQSSLSTGSESGADAEVEFSYHLLNVLQGGQEHLYALRVILRNSGHKPIDSLKLEFAFPDLDSAPRRWEIVGFIVPAPPLPQTQSSGPLVSVSPSQSTISVRHSDYFYRVSYVSKDKIFRSEETDLTDAIGLTYRIDNSVYHNLEVIPPVSWILYADDMVPKRDHVPMSQLNNY